MLCWDTLAQPGHIMFKAPFLMEPTSWGWSLPTIYIYLCHKYSKIVAHGFTKGLTKHSGWHPEIPMGLLRPKTSWKVGLLWCIVTQVHPRLAKSWRKNDQAFASPMIVIWVGLFIARLPQWFFSKTDVSRLLGWLSQSNFPTWIRAIDGAYRHTSKIYKKKKTIHCNINGNSRILNWGYCTI